MANEIIKVLYPKKGLVTQEMLETASEIGVLELYRSLKDIFYKPGILSYECDSDVLLPAVTTSGITVSVGTAVTYSGKLVSVVETLSKSLNLASYVGKTLFIKYVTTTSDDIQTRRPSSGDWYSVSTVKSQNVDDVLFWVDSYDPSSDQDLSTYPDAVPLGKLMYIAGTYAFSVSDGHRRLALPNIPFIGTGHWDGEITPGVTELTSNLYHFLACEGHGTRSTNNPFGLTATDIEHVLATYKSLIYRAGIPVDGFGSTTTNNDWLLVEDNSSSSVDTVKVNNGTAIDWEGRRLYVANDEAVTITDDNTWYYLAIKYKETSNNKDYYEFTLTTYDYGQEDRVTLAKVKNDNGTISIIDQRQTLLCRGYFPEPESPGVPSNIVLTTGYENVNIHDTDIDATYGTGAALSMVERRASVGASNAWIKVSWDASTGDVVAYEILAIQLDSSNNSIDGSQRTARVLGLEGLTPDTKYTFHDLTPGIKYRIKVRAVGRPPHSLRSDYSSYDDIISGWGASLQMGSITLTEKYFGGNITSGQTQSESTTRYQAQGIEISWDQVQYAYGYEVYGKKDTEPNIDTANGRMNSDFYWSGTNLKCFCPAIDGEVWYFKARCFDSGGYPSSNTATGNLTFGDATPPSIPTDLVLSTGFMDELMPASQSTTKTKNIVMPEMAYIQAQWTASTDNKTGVARYDIWIAPDKKSAPGSPDEQLMSIVYSYAQSVTPPVVYTFRDLRPGVKYWIKVRAVDGRGNMSDWCPVVSIVAGGESLPTPDKPVVTLTTATNAVEITWDRDDKAHGYEVYARENADPGSSPSEDYLLGIYKSTRVVYNTPSSGVTGSYTVYVRVRGYNKAGEYGEISDVVSASPSVIDANTFSALKAEVEAARGSAVDLPSRLSVGIDNDGKLKTVTEVESEIADARATYETLGARISAILEGNVDWQYVRIVAKSGGQYSTIQSAINSISTEDFYLILVMPGEYTEDVEVISSGGIDKRIGIVGFGSTKTIINGSLYYASHGVYDRGLMMLKGISVINSTVLSHPVVELTLQGSNNWNQKTIIEDVVIKSTADCTSGLFLGGGRHYLSNVKVLVDSATGYGIKFGPYCHASHSLYAWLNAIWVDSDDAALYLHEQAFADVTIWCMDSTLITDGSYVVDGLAGNAASQMIYMAGCKYNTDPPHNSSNVTAYFGSQDSGTMNTYFSSGLKIEV